MAWRQTALQGLLLFHAPGDGHVTDALTLLTLGICGTTSGISRRPGAGHSGKAGTGHHQTKPSSYGNGKCSNPRAVAIALSRRRHIGRNIRWTIQPYSEIVLCGQVKYLPPESPCQDSVIALGIDDNEDRRMVGIILVGCIDIHADVHAGDRLTAASRADDQHIPGPIPETNAHSQSISAPSP